MVGRNSRATPGRAWLPGDRRHHVGAVGVRDDEHDRAAPGGDPDDRDGRALEGPGPGERHGPVAGELRARTRQCSWRWAPGPRSWASDADPPPANWDFALGGTVVVVSPAARRSSSVRSAAGLVTSPRSPTSPCSGAVALDARSRSSCWRSRCSWTRRRRRCRRQRAVAAAAIAVTATHRRERGALAAGFGAASVAVPTRRRRVTSSRGGHGRAARRRAPCSSAARRAAKSGIAASWSAHGRLVEAVLRGERAELAVDERVERFVGIEGAGRGGIGGPFMVGAPLDAASARPGSPGRRAGDPVRAGSWVGPSSTARAARPRAIRERTVPGGTFSTSEICA